MSFVYRDQLLPALARFNGHSSLFQRFDKVWGKKTIDNIEVYDKKLVFYSGSFRKDKVFDRFLNAIGMSHESFTSQDVDGDIESMWFYIKKGFVWDGSTRPQSLSTFDPTSENIFPTASEVVQNFNNTFQVGDIIEVTVHYGGSLERYIEAHRNEWIATGAEIISDGLDKSAIREVLHSNPWYYFANTRNVTYTKDGIPFQYYLGDKDQPSITARGQYRSRRIPPAMVSVTKEGYEPPAGSTELPHIELGVFALMGDESAFKPIEENGQLKIFDEVEKTSSSVKYDGEVLEYSYTVKYEYVGISESNMLINEIMAYYDTIEDLTRIKGIRLTAQEQAQDKITNSTEDTVFKKSLIGMTISEEINSLYYKGHLRVEAASNMKRRDFAKLLATKLDSDYSVKKASWFEKALSVLIIVVAIVIGVLTYGAGSNISVALGAAAATLTAGSFILAKIGGLSAAGLARRIGAFAEIVGIAAVITGIYAAIQNAGRQAVASQIAQDTGMEATKEAIRSEMAKRTFIDNLKSFITQAVDNALTRITDAFSLVGGDTSAMTAKEMVSFASDGVRGINQAMSLYSDKEQEKINSELNKLKEDEEKYNQEILDRQFNNPAEAMLVMESKITSYDAIRDKIDIPLQDTIGMDGNYHKWNSNVNI